MRWSKVRQLTEASFADSVRGRVRLNVTTDDPRTMGRMECLRSSIIVDRRELVRLERHNRKLVVTVLDQNGRVTKEVRFLVNPYDGSALSARETENVMDLTTACWQYLHSAVGESLASADPFVQSLAILSAKVGKQRLRRLATTPLHLMPAEFLKLRLAAEHSHSAA
ncbi:MAG: hypothetical protein WD359_04475 [Dehalococcoidia bacterium]